MIWHPEKSVILSDIPESCKVHAPVWIGKNVKIGERCKIQAMSFIPEGVTLEDDVFIGPGVIFTNDRHPPSGQWEKTHVHKGVSIGANATILPGVTIYEDAKIGAGSVVTKDVLPGVTMIGNPARLYIPKR